MSVPDKEQVVDPCGKCGHGLLEHNRDFGIPRSQACSHGFGLPGWQECLCYSWTPVVVFEVPEEADA